MKARITKIKKRSGRTVGFKREKIERAIRKAFKAVGEKNGERVKYLTDKVIEKLHRRFDGGVPQVEEIQDTVEEILMRRGHTDVARAYILYRDLRARIRSVYSLVDSDELMEKYLNKSDWRVKENSNMAYSLQGLNNHVASIISANYWLNKIYTSQIREAHTSGDFHIHDLQLLATYCAGWDLRDLLMRGFGGVTGKVECKPAKHLRTALGQLVNFFYTLQGEGAGAQAVSSFDTLLAPFVRADKLSYKEVKQALQEFVFNINIPTRVGFQCVSEDTAILTLDGWRGHEEVKKGDIIKTFNLKTGMIENQKVASVFKKNYKGSMYQVKNRIQDQLISPGHRVVRKRFNSQRVVLEPIEEVLKLKSPFIIPIAGKNSNKEARVSDEQIKLMAWIISEGTIEQPTKHRCCYRVSIYQSKIKNREPYEEIVDLLDHFNLKYSVYKTASLGDDVQQMRLNAKSSRKIHQWFGTRENVHFVPGCLLNLSERQSRLFLETYLKADGFEGSKISTTDLELLDGLQIIIVNSGYGFTVLKRKPTIGKKDIYVLRIIRHQETYIPKVKKVNYRGIIWCPHTKNETIIARRAGKVFITGNTPFTNVTLDLTTSPVWKDEAVIIGGKPQKTTYGDHYKERDMFNRAFAEVMLEGDAKGRVFTFPIPTYNITKDFDWENPNYNLIWEMTRKYGVPYFSNFINSDMRPEDVRSMCCRLRLSHRTLKKRGGGLFGANPLTGSLGVITINLPRIGFLAKDEKDYFAQLSHLMDLTREALLIKRSVLEQFTQDGLYPYSRVYLASVKERFGQYWKNHFSTVGLNGMNESLLNFMGKTIGSEEGKAFSLEVLEFMRQKLLIYQKETGEMFNLEATPAEGTSYRLAMLDKKLYPKIICANEKAYQEQDAAPYYTNSTQLQVNHTDDLFEALDLQDELQTKYTGGTVFHAFLGESLDSAETVKRLVKKIADNYSLPYYTLTPTFSVCPQCGYQKGEHEKCPHCGKATEVFSRIVGYLRPLSQWNKGKRAEFSQRKTFKINSNNQVVKQPNNGATMIWPQFAAYKKPR